MVHQSNPFPAMPRDIVVYAGQGCSHSWTWLADLFEALSFREASFLDERNFVRALEEPLSTVIVSGGDAFSIAYALSGEGFSKLRRFVHSGGDYVGVCAGAYLPLPTSVTPLSEFNICSTRIENIVPSGNHAISGPPRLSVPFCDRSIVHPIRGETMLRSDAMTLIAPMFGGPVFKEPFDGTVICRFGGFTGSTEVQIDPDDAERMVVGRPAVIEAAYGRGRLLLLSPHLEHPMYPEANRLFARLLGIEAEVHEAKRSSVLSEKRQTCALARAASDLSVALHGLEGRSFLMGNKVWDTERFLVLTEAIRRRAALVPEAEAASLSIRLRSIRDIVVDLSTYDSCDVEAVLDPLMSVARSCVNLRLASMRSGR